MPLLRDVSMYTLLVATVFAILAFVSFDLRQLTSVPLPIVDLQIDDGKLTSFDVRTGSMSLEPTTARIAVPSMDRVIELPSLALTRSDEPADEGRAVVEPVEPQVEPRQEPEPLPPLAPRD